MRRPVLLLFFLVFLTGCQQKNAELERGIALRSKLLKAETYSFGLDITADYGDTVQSFSMDCEADREGNIRFCVTAPKTISGITGEIEEEGGKLTFDEEVLCFDLLAEEVLSPVSAPWVLIKTLRAGYLTSAGMDGDQILMSIDDSYEEDALQVDIWLDENDLPMEADILHEGRRILSLKVNNFALS